jgi:hypothetical protein
MSVITVTLAADGADSLNGIFDLVKDFALQHDDEEIVDFIDEYRDELCEPENETDLGWDEVSMLLQVLAYIEPRFSATEYSGLLDFSRQFRASIESAASKSFSKSFGQNRWSNIDFGKDGVSFRVISDRGGINS